MAALAWVTLLAACATPQTHHLLTYPEGLKPRVELVETPFFAQQEYQCGPAALATVLNAAGEAVHPEELTPQVYLPSRHGSLQPELLAATRRQGHIPYVLHPTLDTLVTEISAGNPVLVLQNLGLRISPVWHYAVAIGFDLERAELILRSGTERRHVMPLRTFEHTWRRGGFWAMVVTSPDTLPQTAKEQPYLEAVLALEELKQWPVAEAAYQAVLNRWPGNLAAQVGVGNSRHAQGDFPGAEASFRAAVTSHPDSGIALNNLAQTLADQGKLAEAERTAERAVSIGGELSTVFRQTLEEIRRLAH
ncbi:MAG: PA2778 family cysteine peptidase [Nitrospirota bacterium]|nr:PA2778 family cysteine peptidase [Nitrospirota bacterium]